MVDWLIEVTHSFKCDPKTYFMTVAYFDKYLIGSSERGIVLTDANVHKIGIVSLFLASKFNDVHTLKSKLIIDKIAFGKHTLEELLVGEKEMLSMFDFVVHHTNPFDFHDTYIALLLHKLKVASQHNPQCASMFAQYTQFIHEQLASMALFLVKMSMQCSVF